MPRLRSLGVPIALALLAAAAPASATATHPGVNGRITFMRDDANGFRQTWTANPDLSASVRLTAGDANSGWAVWSPDGLRIAFDSDRADPDLGDDTVINDVYTMRRDGTDVRKLTDSVGFSGDPHYAPDGRTIAFGADRGTGAWGIFLIRTDGTGLRRITASPPGTYDSAPRFSPDGRKLVFTRYREVQSSKQGEPSAVFTVKVDGTGTKQLTRWSIQAGDADWSPDGRKLVFEAWQIPQGRTDIRIMDADGKHLRSLTDGEGIKGVPGTPAFRFEGFHDPVFSPDGRLVLFHHGHLQADGSFRAGLSTIRPDGTGLRWASDLNVEDHQVDWGSAPLG